MPGDFIRIEGLESIDKLLLALKRFPQQVKRNLGAAGLEAVKRVIFPVQGLKRYPPGGPGAPQPFKSDKQRRYFFAALKRGEIEVPYRRGQSPNSEKYGAMWYSKSQGYATEVGNRSSYARYLGGTEQSAYMAKRGWRKLFDIVEEKMDSIRAIYQSWINKTLKDLGL